MKLTNLFEATQEEIFDDYILTNTLYGALAAPEGEKFKAFYKTVKGKPKAAKYYLENKMTTQARKNFLYYNEDDLKRVSFSGENLDVEYGSNFAIYIYDFAGPPPFKFKRNDEVFDFTMFNECKTLTEYPSWFPNHIARYQQVGTSIKSFKNIHKVIESCGDMYFGQDEVIKNVSYLAEIKNLDNVEFSGYPELTKSVNKYLESTAKEDRDAISLQTHLIDDDFETFA